MEIERVNEELFYHIFPNSGHIYNSHPFVEYNKKKCIDIHYLVFKDSKFRFGIVMGETDMFLKNPFSAPFGGFLSNKDQHIQYYDEAAKSLIEYAVICGKRLCITLPPVFYSCSIVTKIISSMQRLHMKMYIDINYHYELQGFIDFEKNLDSVTRNKFRNSKKEGFVFKQLDSKAYDDIATVYGVIKHNREYRGYPLRMTFNDVLGTLRVVPASIFIMSLNDTVVAAALVYDVTERISQVIYWGDEPGFSQYRVMNYFTYKVFEHYHLRGVEMLDIGPSSEEGEPNIGLCEFKESIGCKASPKFTFIG